MKATVSLVQQLQADLAPPDDLLDAVTRFETSKDKIHQIALRQRLDDEIMGQLRVKPMHTSLSEIKEIAKRYLKQLRLAENKRLAMN